ncbi:unnamed protein product [Cochlearia groenlandica]
MGSMSNPNPWAPYDSYTDCSQRICNIYCTQWCYLLFPPPPPSPSSLLDGSSSSSDFSPLLIALIGILAAAFVLVSYYTLISNYCHRHRRENSSNTLNRDDLFTSSAAEPRRGFATEAASGLNDSLIESITVYKYREGDGFGSDCSVCLSEFVEKESLRLLPKCNHAFHLPCIDTWLKSHSNCPLCRSFVTGINSSVSAVTESISVAIESEPVVVIVDLETGSGESRPQPPAEESPERIRRSVSLNSAMVVSIGDVLREIEDGESDGVGTSQRRREEDGCGGEKTTAANRRRGVSSKFLVRSSSAMKRSVSTGRFIFSRSDQQRDYQLPN